MNSLAWANYLFETSLIICLVFALYKAFYERLGHYALNRLLLTAGLLLAVMVPAIHIPVSLGLDAPEWVHMEVLPLDAVEAELEVLPSVNESTEKALNWPFLALELYAATAFGFFIVKLFQLLALKKKLHRAVPSSLGKHIFLISFPSTFSFGKRIFLGKDYASQSPRGQEMMLKHEQSHIDQKHRIDLLIFHLAHCLLWFHPLMPAWGRALRQQHEFLADQASIRQFQNPKAYAKLLLSLSIGKSSPFTHAFAFFTLKKRITMLFKTSSRASKWSYAFMVPIVGLLLCSFSFNRQVLPEPDLLVTQSGDNIPSLKPVDAEIVSGFGMRYNPIKKAKQKHRGIDIRSDIGAHVYAPANGTVTEVRDFRNEGYGKLLTIDHGNGFVTRYAHLSAFEVEEGDEVSRGQIVAKVGNTGRSMGPHLHYEVLKNGDYVDPEPYFTEQ